MEVRKVYCISEMTHPHTLPDSSINDFIPAMTKQLHP